MKRIISFVLCLSMVFSMLPVNAFAMDVDETTAEAEAAQVLETATEAPVIETPAETTEAEEETEAPAETSAETTAGATEGSEAATEAVTEPQQTESEETEPAVTEETVPEETEETIFTGEYTWIPDMDLPSDEELFAAYVDQTLYGTGTSLLGTAAGETLSGNPKLCYDALVPLLKEIAAGERASSVISVGQNFGTAPDVEAALTGTSFSQSELDSLLSALLGDLPYHLYWFDKTAGVKISYSWTSDSRMFITFSFAVSADYSATGAKGTYDLDTTLTGAAANAAANAQDIVDKYADASDYDKLVAYKDEICDLTSYNSSAANSSTMSYGDPWQLIWVFDCDSSTKVVCEGYSKAFQYLCDLSDFDADITCYNVQGTMGTGAHMWNIVSIDGSSYLADVTNSDTDAVGSSGGLFLVGAPANSDGSYTFCNYKFTYDAEVTALWGTGEDSILTLAEEDYDPTVTSDTPEADTSTAMTGEELLEALESASGMYQLSNAVEITSDITLPENMFLITYAYGITIADGGSITIPGSSAIGISGTGVLTVEEGGTLVNDGTISMGNGGVVTVDGALTNNYRIDVTRGTLTVNGTYTSGGSGYIQKDMYGIVSGIDTSEVGLSTTVYTEDDLIIALNVDGEYAYNQIQIVNMDLDQNDVNDPVTLTDDLTIPEGVEIQVGYYTGESAALVIPEGVTLTNNGTVYIISDGTISIEDGGSLINYGTISNSGTIRAAGAFIDNGTFNNNGTYVGTEQIALENFLADVAAAEESGEDVAVFDEITLEEDLTINMSGELYFADYAKLVVPSGVTLTVNCPLYINDAELIVEEGGALILNSELALNAVSQIGGYLLVSEGAEMTINDGGCLWINNGASADINGTLEALDDPSTEDVGVAIHVGFAEGGTLNINGTLSISGYLNACDTVTLSEGGTLNILNNEHGCGYLDVTGQATLDGTVNLDGLMSVLNTEVENGYEEGCANITLNGELNASETSQIFVYTGGSMDIYNELTSYGEITVEENGVLWVESTLNVFGSMNNYGHVQVNCFGGAGIINVGGTWNSYSYTDLRDTGVLNVDGTLICHFGTEADYYGDINLAGTVNVTGTWLYYNDLILSSDNCPTVNVEESGLLSVWGTLGVESGSTLNNSGTVRYYTGYYVDGGTVTGNEPESRTYEKLLGDLDDAVNNGTGLTIYGTVMLEEDLTVSLAEGQSLDLRDGGTLIVPDGVTLTMNSPLNINDGILIVEEGGKVILNAEMAINGYNGIGTAAINGELIANAAVWVNSGSSIDVTGSLISYDAFHVGFGDNGAVCSLNIYGEMTAWAYLNIVEDTGSLWVAEGGTLTVGGALYDNGEPVNNGYLQAAGSIDVDGTLNADGGVDIGNEGGTAYISTGDTGVINVPEGNLWFRVLDTGALLNDGTINNDGAIYVYGTYTNNGTLTGNEPLDGQTVDLNNFLADLEDGGNAELNGIITLTEDLTIALDEDCYLLINYGSKLVVPDGVTLTINSSGTVLGSEIVVEEGAQLILNASLWMDGSYLLVCEGGYMRMNDGGCLWVCNDSTADINGVLEAFDDPSTEEMGVAIHVGFEGNGTLNVNGALSTSGYLNIGDWLNLSEDATLNILNDETGSGYLEVWGTAQLRGTVNLDGLMGSANGNEDLAFVEGTARIEVYGELNGSDTSTIIVYPAASISVTGTLTTEGAVEVQADGTLWVDGDVTFSGPAPVTNYGYIHVNYFTADSGNDAVLNINGEMTTYGYLANDGGTVYVNGTLNISRDETNCGYFNSFGNVYVNGTINNSGLQDIDSGDDSYRTLYISDTGVLNIMNDGNLWVANTGIMIIDGILNVYPYGYMCLYNEVSGYGSWINTGTAHLSVDGNGNYGYTTFDGYYTHGAEAALMVELYEGEPLYCDLIGTYRQTLYYAGGEMDAIRAVLANEEYQTRVVITEDVTIDEDLTIGTRGEMLVLAGLTIAEGATVNAYGPLTLEEQYYDETTASLTVDGLLNTYHPNGALTVGANSTATVNGTVMNGNATTVAGSLVINGTWNGYAPIVAEGGSVTGEGAPSATALLQALLDEAAAMGYPVHLTEDLTLTEDLAVFADLIIDEGVTLTVPKGFTLYNYGVIDIYGTLTVKSGAAFENNSVVCTYPSGTLTCPSSCYSGEGRVQAVYEDGTLGKISGISKTLQTLCYVGCNTEAELRSGMSMVSSGKYLGGILFPSADITLTEDLTVLENVSVVFNAPTDGEGNYDGDYQSICFVIPEGVTVTSNGGIEVGPCVTMEVNGGVVSNGYLYVAGDGELILNGWLDNCGHYTSYGALTLNSSLSNYGTMRLYGDVTQNGTIGNYGGDVLIQESAALNIQSGFIWNFMVDGAFGTVEGYPADNLYLHCYPDSVSDIQTLVTEFETGLYRDGTVQIDSFSGHNTDIVIDEDLTMVDGTGIMVMDSENVGPTSLTIAENVTVTISEGTCGIYLYDNATLVNYGTLIVDGRLNISGGEIVNYGTIIVNGELNQTGGVISNRGGDITIADGSCNLEGGFAWNFMEGGAFGSYEGYPTESLYLHGSPDSAADIQALIDEFGSGEYASGTVQIDVWCGHSADIVIDEDMTIPAGVGIMVMDSEDLGPASLTIAEDVMVIIEEGSYGISVYDGCTLVNNGVIYSEGSLAVNEGASMINNGATEHTIGSTTVIDGSYSSDGGMAAHYDAATGELASITGTGITPAQLYLFAHSVTDESQIHSAIDYGQANGYGSILVHIISSDVTLTDDLTIPANTILRTIMSDDVPATLTVPEGVTVTNNGSVKITAGTTLVIDGLWRGNTPWGDGTITGSNVPMSQEEFQQLLDEAEANGEYFTLESTVNLTEDMEINRYMIIGENGKLIVPSGVTLTNNRLISIYGSLIVEEGGLLVNNHVIWCAGLLDVAEDGFLCDFLPFSVQFEYSGEDSVTQINGIDISNLTLNQETTSSEEEIRQLYAKAEAEGYGWVGTWPVADIELSDDLVIPENGYICYTFGETFTVPEGVTVTNNGSFQVYEGNTLVIDGNWEGNLPENYGGTVTGSNVPMSFADFQQMLSDANGEMVELNAVVTLETSMELTSPLDIGSNGTLLVPSGVTLIVNDQMVVTGKLIVEEGGKIINNSTIDCYLPGVITVDGSYAGDGDVVHNYLFSGSCGTITGIDPAVMTLCHTVYDESVLRSALEIAETEGYGQAVIIVMADISLTADLTIPENVQILTSTVGETVTFTVPGDITLTNNGKFQVMMDTVLTVDGQWEGNMPIVEVGGTLNGSFTEPRYIVSSDSNALVLIGGSSATYTAVDPETGDALKAADVQWFLSDKNGNAIESHPYASITAAGKLSTSTVADKTMVYLMARTTESFNPAQLSAPVAVTLYPAVSGVEIRVGSTNITGSVLLYDIALHGLTYPLSYKVPYPEAVESVTWASSKKTIADIDENGLITVAGDDVSGTVKFTLTVTAINGKKTTASFQMKFGRFTHSLDLTAAMPDGSVEQLGSDTDLTIYSGESITFSAVNKAYDGTEDVTTTGVTWSLLDKTNATISAKGVLKAKTVSNPVTTVVSVQSKDGACGYYISVTILPAPATLTIYDDVSGQYVTKTTQTIEPGDAMFLSAPGYDEVVTWKSSKPAVADFDEETGLLVAYAKGSTTITATAGSLKATFTLKVNKLSDDVVITTKNGADFIVASGKSLNLVGTVLYYEADGSYTSDTKVTWSLEPGDEAYATISSSGKLTAAKNLTESAVITVYADANDGCSYGFMEVEVVPVATAVELYGPFGSGSYDVDVSNTVQKWDMVEGDSFSLSAVVFPYDAMQNVTWKSSSAKIAAIDEDGNVTCLKSGTVTITATAGDGSGKKASFKLTVSKTMEYLELPETAIIGGGKSLTLTKLDGYAIDTLATNQTLTWTLTYPDGSEVPTTVASLSKGVLKTKTVTKPVTVTVTAESTDGSELVAECEVTIYPVTKGVQLFNADLENISKKTVSVPVNQGYTVLPDTTNVSSYGYDDDMTADEYVSGEEAWTVTYSKAGIAEVTFDGQAMTVYAIGEPVGQSVKITLKANDGSGKSAYFTLTFTEAEPESISFTVMVDYDGWGESYETFQLESTAENIADALVENGLIVTTTNSSGELTITEVNGAAGGSSSPWAMEYNGQMYYVNYDEIPLEANGTYILMITYI